MSIWRTIPTMGTPKEVLGATIRDARRARGLRQEDVAAYLGMSTKQIGRWEKGVNAPGSLALVRLLKFFRQRADEPDLAALDTIVAQEVSAAVAAELEQEPDNRAHALILMEQLIQYPRRFERWLIYGSGLLDADDDTD